MTKASPAGGEDVLTLTPEENAPTTDYLAKREPLGQVIAIRGSKVTIAFQNSSSGKRSTLLIGSLVTIPTKQTLIFGLISGIEKASAQMMGITGLDGTADLDLLCEVVLMPDKRIIFQRGVSVYPQLGSKTYQASPFEIGQIYAKPAASNIKAGTLFQDPSVPVYLMVDELLGKHFAILGTTGTGKSCTVTLLLNLLLEKFPFGRVLLLDPHNEYSTAFGDKAEVINTTNFYLPYWMFNLEEIAGVLLGELSGEQREADLTILKAAILHSKQKYLAEAGNTTAITVDTPVPYRYNDVIALIDLELGRLEKSEDNTAYIRLRARLDSLRKDQRYAFLFSGMNIQDSMGEVISRLLRIPVNGRPISIFDLSGVPSEIVDVVVSVLCRVIFDFSLWSAVPQEYPILLVCEEAHRYTPADREAGFAPTRREIARIAKEGRKYGVSLCLVTQRPSELDSTILSQCNTIFALRMGNERDRTYISNILPEGSTGLMNALPSLKSQEAIAVGEAVTVPTRLRFDDLPEDKRPQSSTAAYSKAWLNEAQDSNSLYLTIERWRLQQR